MLHTAGLPHVPWFMGVEFWNLRVRLRHRIHKAAKLCDHVFWVCDFYVDSEVKIIHVMLLLSIFVPVPSVPVQFCA